MVSPFEILPVLAMAGFIVLLPLLADPPEPPKRAKPSPTRSTQRTRTVSVPSISLRD